MTKRKCSGIRSLEDLRIRCVIDDVTECWIYPTVEAVDPRARVWLPPDVVNEEKGRTLTIRKAAWILAGKKLPKGHLVYGHVCVRLDCANPEHSRAASRANMGAAQAKSGRMKGDPARAITNRRNFLKQALPMERIAEVKALLSQGLQNKQVAERLDLHPTTVSRIRKGTHVRMRSVGVASVFDLARAA